MSYSIPDPHYEELILPGQKPIGNVAIDWGHPLTDELIGYWLLPNLVDLVSGKVATVSSGSPTFHGDHISFVHGNLDEIDCGIFNYKSTNFTSGILMQSSNTASDAMCLAHNNAGTISWFMGSSFNLARRIQVANKNVVGVIDATKHWLVGRFDNPANILYLFQNGIKTAERPNTTVNAQTTGRIYIGSRGGISYFTGDVYAVWLYDKVLSDEVIAELNRNPYQFLIPA